ncbi:phosphate transport system regulatory protein PhoU [Rubidibacter lacunae KORDI 51-2]|uniref:Phosphate-specific transport system accessory protein PhoU n=1 Tax=Rubidibacter lacunae KORDI 51-2 TaxID=582515 RepID=U5DEA2_9CHRO|nr:phosphate signaling complex protein PhoU [Rubidibacter lacunae]ERN39956.1 phosphate transport system regulatory protein PhoU [Rubidibacter lacunae KORDI 51-2]
MVSQQTNDLDVGTVDWSAHSNVGGDRTFERSLKRLEQDVLRMGALVEQSFRLSHEALFARNLAAAKHIKPLDEEIDRYYRQIESDCAMLMSLQATLAEDVRLLSALMQLVRDLERIGDYAEDLAELALKLFPYPPNPHMAEIESMSNHSQVMLAVSLMALADLDVATGRRVKQMDDTVDDAYDRIYGALAQTRDVPGPIEPFLLLGLAIRHLERMADHATNIGQRVTYIVTGHRG